MSRPAKRTKVPKLSGFTQAIHNEDVNRRFRLSTTGTFATSGAGTLSSVITMDPSATNDWGLLNGYYDEFRVIGVRLYMVSSQQYSVTKLNAIGYVLFDNDSTGAQSFTTASQYAHKKIIPAVFDHKDGEVLTIGFQRPATASSPIPWSDVATPSGSPGSLQVIFSVAALTASTEYFQYHLEYYIEARGRR